MPAGGQAFRIGADEFVVTLDAAPRVGRRVASAGSCAPRRRLRLGRTVSVGVAVGAPGGESGEAVVSACRRGAWRGEAARLRRRRRGVGEHRALRGRVVSHGGGATALADSEQFRPPHSRPFLTLAVRRHHEPERVRPRGHALQPAATNSPSQLSSAPAGSATSTTRPSKCGTARWRSIVCVRRPHARRDQRHARARGDDHDVELAVGRRRRRRSPSRRRTRRVQATITCHAPPANDLRAVDAHAHGQRAARWRPRGPRRSP